jgi:hypothetical protein
MSQTQTTVDFNGAQYPVDDVRAALDRFRTSDGSFLDRITNEWAVEGSVAITGDVDYDQYVYLGGAESFTVNANGRATIESSDEWTAIGNIESKLPDGSASDSHPDHIALDTDEELVEIDGIAVPAETTLELLDAVTTHSADLDDGRLVTDNGIVVRGDSGPDDWVWVEYVEDISVDFEGNNVTFDGENGNRIHKHKNDIRETIEDEIGDDFVDIVSEQVGHANTIESTQTGAQVRYEPDSSLVFAADELQNLAIEDAIEFGSVQLNDGEVMLNLHDNRE